MKESLAMQDLGDRGQEYGAGITGLVMSDGNGNYRTKFCPHLHKSQQAAYRCLKNRTREKKREIYSAEEEISKWSEFQKQELAEKDKIITYVDKFRDVLPEDE